MIHIIMFSSTRTPFLILFVMIRDPMRFSGINQTPWRSSLIRAYVNDSKKIAKQMSEEFECHHSINQVVKKLKICKKKLEEMRKLLLDVLITRNFGISTPSSEAP